MKVGNVSNVRFRSSLEMEDCRMNPSLSNFRYLRNDEKLDMIYETLLKQDKKIAILSQNQQNLKDFNHDGFVTLMRCMGFGEYTSEAKMNSLNLKNSIDVIV